jgi:uncharacterized protein
MPFNLFHKKKQPETEAPAVPSQETPQQTESTQPPPEASTVQEPAAAAEIIAAKEEQPQETPATPQEVTQEPPVAPQPAVPEPEVKAETASNKTYLKAMPLKELADVEKVKAEVKGGNIIILRITPLASKSIEEVKTAVNDLFQFAEETGGDIARLGEERVVICPKNIRIWREKTPAPVKSGSEPLPTTA